jgi:hypothetical protein
MDVKFFLPGVSSPERALSRGPAGAVVHNLCLDCPGNADGPAKLRIGSQEDFLNAVGAPAVRSGFWTRVMKWAGMNKIKVVDRTGIKSI